MNKLPCAEPCANLGLDFAAFCVIAAQTCPKSCTVAGGAQKKRTCCLLVPVLQPLLFVPGLCLSQAGLGVGRSCLHFWVKLFVTAFQACLGNAYGRSFVGLESTETMN